MPFTSTMNQATMSQDDRLIERNANVVAGVAGGCKLFDSPLPHPQNFAGNCISPSLPQSTPRRLELKLEGLLFNIEPSALPL